MFHAVGAGRFQHVFLDPDQLDVLMLRMVQMCACAAVLVVSCEVQAGQRSFTRESSRVQSNSGSYGHHVSLPGNSYEGVAVGSSRREAIANACYANDSSKRAVSKSVTRGANGMFYSSVLYRNR